MIVYQLNPGRYNWNGVISTVLTLPKHEDLLVEKWMVPEIPQEFKPRFGDSDGQIEDYGYALEDGKGIHIKEYDTYYKVHWDERDPGKDPLGHLIKDAPHWLVVILLALGIFALARGR